MWNFQKWKVAKFNTYLSSTNLKLSQNDSCSEKLKSSWKKITFCKRKQITQYEDSQARGYRKRCAAPTWLRFFKSKLIFGSNLEVWDQKKHMPALKNFSKFSVEISKKIFFFKTLIFDFWQLIFGIYAWN